MSIGGNGDEKDHQILVTVAAMKLLLGRLYTYVYTIANLSPEDVLTVHARLRETLPNQALVRSNDPAMSDVLSDDVAREIDRILQGVEKEIAAAAARKKDPREPF
jgi:hypothetical protein